MIIMVLYYIIAAFFGGLMLGVFTHEIRERVQEYGEAEGLQLSLFVFLGFAMLMVPKAYLFWDASAWIYAILSLTMIRMLPVAISLTGLKLGLAQVSFIGWFGPRASWNRWLRLEAGGSPLVARLDRLPASAEIVLGGDSWIATTEPGSTTRLDLAGALLRRLVVVRLAP